MSRAFASRYQPALVALHWLTGLMIIGLLCLGFFVLSDMPNSDPRKVQILVWHASGGMAVLVLMLIRLTVRLRSARPAPATIGSSKLDRLASLAHLGLYAIVFLMIVTGWVTGFLVSDAFLPGHRLPDRLTTLPTFQAHAILASLLALLITAHIAAALYHQVVLKDGLLGRMGFGRRTVERV